jgi:glycerol uptake facilitator-like aquaporin
MMTNIIFEAITICFWFWQGFPIKKVPYYILSQIFGAFMAGLLLMGQYHEQISALRALNEGEGLPLVATAGPAGILCTYPLPNQTNQGYLFLIEFFVDSFIVWPRAPSKGRIRLTTISGYRDLVLS